MPAWSRWISLLVLAAGAIWAQADANKSALAGTVVDAEGAPLSGARVSVSNRNTASRREMLTNTQGQYRFGALEPGEYELIVEATGFAPLSVKPVILTVGASLQVNLTETEKSTTVVVDLSDPPPLPVDSASSEVLPQPVIRDLPIDGRRFQDFARLTPTVEAVPETRHQLSFVGQRGVNSNVMVDGVDYNEPLTGGIRGGERSSVAFTLPQNAIQEFQSVASGYSVEYGRSTGGLLNAITRSGSNAYHGDGFYQLRHHSLGLTNPLGQQSLENQHQLGGAIGGPVLRDRLFFFAAAEQQWAAFPRRVRFSALDGLGSITPDIAPGYNYFRSLEGPFDQTNDVSAALGRIDYQFSQTHLTGRYNFSQNRARNAALGNSLNPDTNNAFSANGNEQDNTHTAVGQWTTLLSGRTINDLRVQYSREEYLREANSFSPTVQAGVIGTFGTSTFLPSIANNHRLQLADSLTFETGAHALKLGVDFSTIGARQNQAANQFGAYIITTSDARRALEILSSTGGAAGNRFDDPSVVYRRQVGSPDTSISARQIAFFLQDNWQVKSSLTLNYGLRWEGQFNPSPVTDNAFLLTNVRDTAFPLGRVNPGVLRDQLGQWAPRLGLAWNIGGRGHTVLRAQGGLFYGQTPITLLVAPLNNFRLPGGDLTLEIAPTNGGSVYDQFQRAGFDFNLVPLDRLPIYSVADVWMKVAGQPNQFANSSVITTSGDGFRNPRAFQVGIGLEHQLSSGLTIDYQFNQVNAVHLERNIDFNVPRPFVRPGDLSLRPFFGLRSGTLRPNPNLASVLLRDSSARSNYVGNTFRVRYQHQRLQMAAHYTLAFNKSDDDNERSLTGTTYQNPFDLGREYNWSALDARHQVNGYLIYRAPLGLEMAALFHFRSGLPIDATTGEDSSELLSGTIGNRPLERPGVPMLRNAFRNRAYRSVDLRILKDLPIREPIRLQLSCELFNVLNFHNLFFLPSDASTTNPAFIYGPGILTDGRAAPVDPRFLNLRGANGQYDPSSVGQQGTPFQAQVGIRLFF